MEPTPITPTAPERASQEIIQERVRTLTRPYERKMTDTQWLEVKLRAEAGEPYDAIAASYPIGVSSIEKKAQLQRWATPARVSKGLRNELPKDDPASIVADIWRERGLEARETIHDGASKALKRFFAMAPVPQSFGEAQIAAKLLNDAIKPPEEQQSNGNVNLAILTAVGFTPRIQD